MLVICKGVQTSPLRTNHLLTKAKLLLQIFDLQASACKPKVCKRSCARLRVCKGFASTAKLCVQKRSFCKQGVCKQAAAQPCLQKQSFCVHSFACKPSVCVQKLCFCKQAERSSVSVAVHRLCNGSEAAQDLQAEQPKVLRSNLLIAQRTARA